MGISAIRRTCEHLRSHAPGLNPLARGCSIWPDANYLLRQGRALLRSNGSRTATCLLTALNSYQSNASRNAHQLRASHPSRRYTRGFLPTAVHLPPPRSQTLRSHRAVLPDIMFARTPANSNGTSLLLSCPSGLSRQTFANLDLRWTGAPFYPLLCQVRRRQLPSGREYMYNRISHQSRVRFSIVRFASNSDRLPSTDWHSFGLPASMSIKHISITP